MTATTPSSRSAQLSRSAISGMGTLSNPWSGMPRQRPATSPLTLILGGHADAGDFTEDQLDRLRRHVAVATPRMPTPDMEEFLGQTFAQPEVVAAYFRPTPMVGRSVPPHATRMVLPFDHALRAAKRAAAMPVLWPQERGLAWLSGIEPSARGFSAQRRARFGASKPKKRTNRSWPKARVRRASLPKSSLSSASNCALSRPTQPSKSSCKSCAPR